MEKQQRIIKNLGAGKVLLVLNRVVVLSEDGSERNVVRWEVLARKCSRKLWARRCVGLAVQWLAAERRMKQFGVL